MFIFQPLSPLTSLPRVVALPTPVNPEKVEASCKDGILTIKLAKPEEVKPRNIQVKSA